MAVAAAFALSIQKLICKSEVIDGVSIVTYADAEAGSGDEINIAAETERKADVFADKRY